MKRFLLPTAFILLSCTMFAQECPNNEFGSYCQTKGAVTALLPLPGYTDSSFTTKVLMRAGDMAALAVIRSVSIEDLNSPDKMRPILSIVSAAFSAPQFIAAETDRKPTATMLLLEHLSRTTYGQEHIDEIEDTGAEIHKNTGSGTPVEYLSPDWEHTQWVSRVLRSTSELKPGMTRTELLRVYRDEGGLFTRMSRTYALRQCPYIKVDVEFSPAGNANDQFTEHADDKILKISKPYLEYSIMD